MPVELPQLVFTTLVLPLIAVGSAMVTVCVLVQPTASVTVTVYVPAESPVAEAFVPPLGAHK